LPGIFYCYTPYWGESRIGAGAPHQVLVCGIMAALLITHSTTTTTPWMDVLLIY